MNTPHPSWLPFFDSVYKQTYFKTLQHYVALQRQSHIVYPPINQVFKVFDYPLNSIKCVILGQDPYHQPNQAMGLAFSVPHGSKLPPSLRNIFKELTNSYPQIQLGSGNLEPWAKQGVFLLNTILTVQQSKPLSHANNGWEQFTNQVIQHINTALPHVVFMLWGASAQQFSHQLSARHTVLQAPHPSPLSAHRGFLGCNHFILCNNALINNNQTPINWEIPLFF